MKNKTINLWLLLTLIACDEHFNRDRYGYSGYFMDDSTHKPIQGVFVREIGSGLEAMSDSTGYFKISHHSLSDERLFIYKDNYINDTLYAYGNQAGEHIVVFFNGYGIPLHKAKK